MQLSFVLSVYGHFFYVMGQSIYDPLAVGSSSHWHGKKSLSLLHYKYLIVYFGIVVGLATFGESLELQALMVHDTTATPLLAIAIALTSCSSFATIVQCIVYRNILATIHQLFGQVNHLFRNNLRQNISFQTFRNAYRKKFITSILLCTVNAIVVLWLNSAKHRELLITIVELILSAITVLTNLHTIFYIDLHVFIQEKLCSIIDSVSGSKYLFIASQMTKLWCR